MVAPKAAISMLHVSQNIPKHFQCASLPVGNSMRYARDMAATWPLSGSTPCWPRGCKLPSWAIEMKHPPHISACAIVKLRCPNCRPAGAFPRWATSSLLRHCPCAAIAMRRTRRASSGPRSQAIRSAAAKIIFLAVLTAISVSWLRTSLRTAMDWDAWSIMFITRLVASRHQPRVQSVIV